MSERMGLVEAARRLGVSEQTVRRRVKSGEIEAIQIGGRYYITPEALKDFEERHKVNR